MPLTPEETQAEARSDENAANSNQPEEPTSRFSAVVNSKYLKPVGAVLLALGAGCLIRLFSRRKNTEHKKNA